MEIRTITITPDTMLKLLAGGKMRALNANLPADTKVTRSGFNQNAGEFWVQIEAQSFRQAPGSAPMPQEFRIEIPK